MPIVKVMDMTGKEVGEITLSDVIFGAEINGAVLHAAVRTYLMNQRQGTQSTLTRTEVSGGGKKPWRQKGTGRARQGSTRAPQWTHGGVALGPKPRDYRLSMNKKARRAALYSALSAKVAEGNLIVVDDIKCAEYK
ncbi:MAG: 50S ribosomal protein L4, partial [Clostridia bacterium]|nr:50S ribosomal protein L4 [Clostridia bacterium]